MILAIRTGGEADPLGHAGTASLLSAMLTEGTTSRTSLQVADQEAFLGVHLGAASEWERSTISLHTPTAQIDSALALFADVALHASLPVADLERVRRERLTALKQLRDEGPAIAALVPPTVTVTLLADREYGSLAMTRWCLARDWHFCLRLTPIKPQKEPLVPCG